MPNKTRAEMWSTPKPGRELSRLRDCRSILDSLTESHVLYTSHFFIHVILLLDYFVYAKFACMQVEWTPYITSPRALLNEHPRTAYIECITCFDIVEEYLSKRTVSQLGFLQAIPPAPMRPTHALRLAQGTYSVTFASPPIYTEAWSRFPYCACIGDQALHRASVPSEVDPGYVNWFRESFHPYILPGEGPSASFGPADSRVEYVRVLIYLFSFMSLSYLNAVYYLVDTFFLLQ